MGLTRNGIFPVYSKQAKQLVLFHFAIKSEILERGHPARMQAGRLRSSSNWAQHARAKLLSFLTQIRLISTDGVSSDDQNGEMYKAGA